MCQSIPAPQVHCLTAVCCRYEPPALEFKTEDQHETAKKVGKGVAIVVAGVVVLAAAVWGWQFFMEVEKKKGKSVDKSKEVSTCLAAALSLVCGQWDPASFKCDRAASR